MSTVGKSSEMISLEKLLQALNDPQLVEILSRIEHDDRWSGWEKYREKMVDKTHVSGELYIDRWRRLRNTPYVEMTDKEKESDRIEVRRTLLAIRGFILSREDSLS